jgi:peptidoglycan/xylan/chitin deacetylase (PgdA/CDA1 family)
VYRLSALLAVLCIGISGCGITFVPAPGSTSEAQVGVPGVVTLTFDDGRISNATAAKLLAEHRLHGTFFINSGTIDSPGFLTRADLNAIAASGNEIGGHTVSHPNFSTFTYDEIKRQVCEDRNTLLAWGFPVRNFAYPFGYVTPEIKQIVTDCGYNSARGLGGLKTIHAPDASTGYSCGNCPMSEIIPPDHPMDTKAVAQIEDDWSVDDLKNQVMANKGGWVQLTFHGICPTDCSDITVAHDRFDQFLIWLADQQAQGKLIVRTVGNVMGGPVRSPVPLPAPVTSLANGSLEATQDRVPDCWERFAWGNNKPEFSLVPHGDGVAERLVMKDYVDGGANLIPTRDLGTCSIAVQPGGIYTISASYTSTVPTQFSVQYRTEHGRWVYGTLSPVFNPATEFTPASWVMPPIPEGVTGISFGMSLQQNGELVTDDYALLLESDTPS